MVSSEMCALFSVIYISERFLQKHQQNFSSKNNYNKKVILMINDSVIGHEPHLLIKPPFVKSFFCLV